MDGDLSWLFRYEETLRGWDKLGYNAKSKPPGTSLLYWATERLANRGRGDDPYLTRRARMATVAAWTWPLSSSLVVLPLLLLGRRWGDEGAGVFAGMLLVTLPPLQLMTMHVDQAFLPTLALLPLAALSLQRPGRRVYVAGAAGAMVFLAWFVSFSTLGVGVVLAAAIGGLALQREHRWNGRAIRLLQLTGGVAVGLWLLHTLGQWAIGYDGPRRFREALVFHQQFKRWDTRASTRWYFAALNTVEWVHWVGIPLVGLWLVSAWRGLRGLGRAAIPHTMSLGLVATLAATALTGTTKGETARLWLWFGPIACLGAGQVLAELAPRWRRALLPSALLLQWGTLVLLKLRQDFQ